MKMRGTFRIKEDDSNDLEFPDDLFVQIATLNRGEPIPEGFRVLSGNDHFSEIARIVLRCELEDEEESNV